MRLSSALSFLYFLCIIFFISVFFQGFLSIFQNFFHTYSKMACSKMYVSSDTTSTHQQNTQRFSRHLIETPDDEAVQIANDRWFKTTNFQINLSKHVHKTSPPIPASFKLVSVL